MGILGFKYVKNFTCFHLFWYGYFKLHAWFMFYFCGMVTSSTVVHLSVTEYVKYFEIFEMHIHISVNELPVQNFSMVEMKLWALPVSVLHLQPSGNIFMIQHFSNFALSIFEYQDFKMELFWWVVLSSWRGIKCCSSFSRTRFSK